MKEDYQENKREVLNVSWIWKKIFNHLKPKSRNQTKITEENPNMDHGMRKTCNIVRGRNIFKGNTLNIWSHSNDITIANSYYMNSVVQRYNKNSDVTKIQYHIFSKRGNWMTDLIKRYCAHVKPDPILPTHNGIYMSIPRNLFKENNDKAVTLKSVEMRLTEWGDVNTTIEIECNDKGIYFKNNWENIDTLKRMSKIVSFILNNIKENPSAVLNKTLKPCDERHAWLIDLTLNDLKL